MFPAVFTTCLNSIMLFDLKFKYNNCCSCVFLVPVLHCLSWERISSVLLLRGDKRLYSFAYWLLLKPCQANNLIYWRCTVYSFKLLNLLQLCFFSKMTLSVYNRQAHRHPTEAVWSCKLPVSQVPQILAYRTERFFSEAQHIFVFSVCEFLSCKSDGLNFLSHWKGSFVKEVSVTFLQDVNCWLGTTLLLLKLCWNRNIPLFWGSKFLRLHRSRLASWCWPLYI